MSKARRYVLPQEDAIPPPPQAASITRSQPSLSPPTQSISIAQSQQMIFPWANPKVDPLQPYSGILAPYFRSTVGVFPANPEIANSLRIPLGLVVTPTQAFGAPVLDFSVSSIVRCSKCHSYLSPKVKISQNGRTWICPMCSAENQVINNPYDPVPFAQKTELFAPVYDMVAPASYIQIQNAGNSFLFVIDISATAVSIGLTSQMIASLKSTIPQMPPATKVGLVTMSDKVSVIDFNRNSEFVISDLSDTVVPFTVMANLSECSEKFLLAVDSIEKSISSPVMGHCLGSALAVAEEILRGVGGCLILAFSDLPTHGPYPLKPRNLEATSETQLLRLPTDASGKFFRDISFRLNRVGASVHIFAAGEKFCDLSTLAVPSGLSGGSCHFYGAFDEAQRSQFHNDLFGTLTKSYLWDSNIRLRCSSGIKVAKTHGNFMIRGGELLIFPVLSPDTSVAFELTITAPINYAVFQMAMLWTSPNRQRMIRVFTFSLPISSQIDSIRASVDETALINIITKRALNGILTAGPLEASQNVRKEAAQFVPFGGCMPSTNFLIHSLICSEALRASNTRGVDGRMATIIRLRSISPTDLLLYLYPRMFSVDERCTILPLNGQSFGSGFCFVVHTVDQIFVWVSKEASPEYLSGAFGVTKIDELPKSVPSLETKQNKAIRKLLEGCCALSRKYLPVEVIPCGSPRESVFKDIIVDDSAVCGANLSTWVAEMKGMR